MQQFIHVVLSPVVSVSLLVIVTVIIVIGVDICLMTSWQNTVWSTAV